MHRTLADLYRRQLAVRSRHLAAAASVPDALLQPTLRAAAARYLHRLATTPAADPALARRAARLAAVLKRPG